MINPVIFVGLSPYYRNDYIRKNFVEFNTEEYLNDFCSFFGVKKEYLKGKTRVLNIAIYRHLFCYYANSNGISLVGIGKCINRHYSTVFHSVKEAENILKYKSDIRLRYNNFINKK